MKYDINKKLSKGAQRTLKDFRDSIIILLLEKPFSSITVSEICDQKNYPRATFYNYFQDKNDLLQYSFEQIAIELNLSQCKELNKDEIIDVYFDKLYDFFENNKELIQKVLIHDDGNIISLTKSFLFSKTREILKDCYKQSDCPVPTDLLSDYYSSSISLLIQYCFTNHYCLSKDLAHHYLDYLIKSRGNI